MEAAFQCWVVKYIFSARCLTVGTDRTPVLQRKVMSLQIEKAEVSSHTFRIPVMSSFNHNAHANPEQVGTITFLTRMGEIFIATGNAFLPKHGARLDW